MSLNRAKPDKAQRAILTDLGKRALRVRYSRVIDGRTNKAVTRVELVRHNSDQPGADPVGVVAVEDATSEQAALDRLLERAISEGIGGVTGPQPDFDQIRISELESKLERQSSQIERLLAKLGADEPAEPEEPVAAGDGDGKKGGKGAKA